jgi:TRAP-type mannitol/chloroaromatic compound transport system permease small subunit
MELLARIDRISDRVGRAASWLLPVLTFIVAYDVIARYVFRKPTLWAYDTAYMLYAANFLLGGAYVHSKLSHIRVDVFLNRFSAHTKAVLEVFFYVVLFFPLMIIMTYSSILYAIDSWKMLELSIHTPIFMPLYPIKTVTPIAFFLFLLQGIADFIRKLVFLKTGKEVQC